MKVSWDDFELDENILRGLYSYGFDYPSDIQVKAFEPFKSGRDVTVQSQSGTGKTCAFIVGSTYNLDHTQNINVIILSPTRELAIQTYNLYNHIVKYTNIKIQLCIGGTSVSEDCKNLQTNKPKVIVGCIGRVYDLICRNKIDTKHLKTLIIDEADEMLSQTFKLQLYDMFQVVPENVQIALVSATTPNEFKDITKSLCVIQLRF